MASHLYGHDTHSEHIEGDSSYSVHHAYVYIVYIAESATLVFALIGYLKGVGMVGMVVIL